MRLSKPTKTLKSWLAITETEIAKLKDSKGQPAEAGLAHATKTRDIIVGELRLRGEEAHGRAA